MRFEELQQAVERQWRDLQETVDRELMAMAQAEERHQRAIAKMLHALEALEGQDATRRLPDQGLPTTW